MDQQAIDNVQTIVLAMASWFIRESSIEIA